MGLASAVQGALRPAQIITWQRADGTTEDLTGATLSGVIKADDTGETRAIAGSLDLTDANDGVFTWSYHADDVAEAGRFTVQFTATYGSQPSPARTIPAPWLVYEVLT